MQTFASHIFKTYLENILISKLTCYGIFTFTNIAVSNIAKSPTHSFLWMYYMCVCVCVDTKLRLKKFSSFKNRSSTFDSTMLISNKNLVFWYITQIYSTCWIMWHLKIQSIIYLVTNSESPCVWADVCYFMPSN